MFYLPTTVNSILSNSKAIATMTRTSWRDPRHRIIQCLLFSHDDAPAFDWSGDIWPVGPPGSVDCILLTDSYCKQINKPNHTDDITIVVNYILLDSVNFLVWNELWFEIGRNQKTSPKIDRKFECYLSSFGRKKYSMCIKYYERMQNLNMMLIGELHFGFD